jgi:hypothetical protein
MGEGWLVTNAPTNGSAHRRSVQVLDEGLFTAQRYAIDLVRVLGEGTFDGDPLDNAAYHAYGVEVLAVFDGTISEIRDGIPENVPGPDSRAVEITYDTLVGNYVVLDLGNGRSAVYAHLIPGSLRVAVGDEVSEGDVLGQVGNSGNSSEPHLHFHFCDSPTALACHGRPYGFRQFVQIPIRVDETAETGFSAGAPEIISDELPVELGYLIFTPPEALESAMP